MSLIQRAVVALCTACLCFGCGEGEDDADDGEGNGSGTVTAEWSEFCVARFTEDYPATDVFGEPTFVAKSGEEYLLTEYGDDFGLKAVLAYLTPVGPDEFEVEAESVAALPFTTDCPLNTSVPYYAVFDDVTVYAEESLITELCSLAKGSAQPRDPNAGSGYSIAGELNLSGPMTYEVVLNVFSAQCGNAQRGYISVPQTTLFGTRTWLVPIGGLLRAP